MTDGGGLDRKLTLPAKRQPLSGLLRDVQSAASGGVQLSRADSVQDESVFCVVNGKTTRALLVQIPRLLTDSEWQYQWQDRTPNAEHSIHRLWREPVNIQARQAFARKQAHDRLARLLADLQAGGQGDPQDPDAADMLAQPIHSSGIAMLGTLADSQINNVLAGHPLTIPFSALTPEQQDLATQAGGGYELGTLTAPNGEVTVDYDKQDLPKTGHVVIKAIPSETDPGALSISLDIYSQPDSPLGMGGDVLHPDPDAELASPPAEAAPDAGVQNASAQAATPTPAPDTAPAAQTVTLDAAMKLKPGQSPLEGYLSAFAAQTHLSILGYWADDAREPQPRLSQSITQRPIKEALNILARTYHAKYIVDDKTVLFRSKFPKAPASAAPAPAPQPAPASGSTLGQNR